MAMRAAAFRGGTGDDGDAFDDHCRHVMVEDAAGRLVASFRLSVVTADGLGQTYAAQFHDLSPLAARGGPFAEMGRLCLRAGPPDPDALRLAWGAITVLADEAGVRMLIGCTSFPGTDPAPHAEALALLRDRHLAPADWRPRCRAAAALPLPGHAPDPAAALRQMPPLMRSYLAMGARVGDHAVADADLGTLHVFTGLEVAAIPPARLRALRALGAALPR